MALAFDADRQDTWALDDKAHRNGAIDKREREMGNHSMVNLKDAIAGLFYKDYEPYKYHRLAQYNAERGRGIVHTDEWKKIMRQQQEGFNAEQRRRHEEESPND